MYARTACLFGCLAVCLAGTSRAELKQASRNPKFDPNARVVELFDGIDQGTIEATVVARNSHSAKLYVTNTSSEVVSVKLPPAVVAVHVLKQFGVGGNKPGGRQGNSTGVASGPGMGQPIGGGALNGFGNNGPGGNNPGLGFNNVQGNGFNNGPGFGIFSVSPDKSVQIPLATVCLAHGKPDPRSKMTYRLVRLEDYTSDPVLQETLRLFAAGSVNTKTAQAAAWHLTDKLSFAELRAKHVDPIGLPPLSYFTEDQLEGAQRLVEQAREQVTRTARREASRAP